MVHSGLAYGQTGTFSSQVKRRGGAAEYEPPDAPVVCGHLVDPPAHHSDMYRSHLRHLALQQIAPGIFAQRCDDEELWLGGC